MKHDTSMRDGIEAALKAMTVMLQQALTVAVTAHQHIRRNEQNMAVGTILPAEDALDRSLTLFRAVIAMHRFKQ
jgi:hypothetical protein